MNISALNISFRTRLFAVAALIVGAVLAAVMTLGWSSVLAVEVERLDDRLCMEARRIATRPAGADDELSQLEADIALKLRLGSADQLLLAFEPTDGRTATSAIRWRGAALADDLHWAARPPEERGLPPPVGPGPGGGPQALPPGTCSLASFTRAGGPWRAARFEQPSGRSLVAADLASVKAELQSAVQRALTIVIPLALLLTALGAWLLASLSLRPVNRLRMAMKGVTGQALDRRLPSAGEDREFKALIGDYNTMLVRLETSFHQASRFSADAAHELKTPLTILQGRLEHALSRTDHPADHPAVQADLSDMLAEVGRLATITRKLLLLSQADAGRLALSLTRVNLTELLDALVSDAQMLVTDQTLAADIEPNLVMQGDALLLQQVFNNLINNAVRYCRPGGWIEVRSRRLPGGIETVFANQTHTIPADIRARFFERFFRGDAAHQRGIEGSGLGLGVAREIARAHGGELTLEPGRPDEARLRLWWPLP